MDAIKATVRNGRIEVDGPLDLPDGTELLVFPSTEAAGGRGEADDDDDWDDTPQGIADWLRWYDSLQPLIFTPEELEAWSEDRRARREWELAHADERAEKLQRLWE
jgi:hypothetical protein